VVELVPLLAPDELPMLLLELPPLLLLPVA